MTLDNTTDQELQAKAERKAKRKEQVQSNRLAVNSLKGLITKITNEFSLDEDRMDKRIDSAMRSEYGAINGLVNLIASIANWPVEPGDGSMVSSNRHVLESDKFKLDLLLLDDIRAARGYHTFMAITDDLEILEGVEPAYEEYTDLCEIFLEELGIESNRPTINKTKWQNAEKIAKERAEVELESRKIELQKHKEFLETQQ